VTETGKIGEGLTMTSRERVLAVLEHREPDRIPLNMSLTVDIYHRLREHLGLPPEPEKKMGTWTDVSASRDLLDAMQLDVHYTSLQKPANWHPPKTDNGLLYDEWGVGREKVVREDGSYYYEMVKFPLANATLKDIERYPWPDPEDDGRIACYREQVLQIRRETDRAIMFKPANSIWEQSWWVYGMENWLMDMAMKPGIVCAIMDKITDIAVRLMEIGMDEVGDLIDIVRLSGEDLGTQLAPMISPKMFEEMVRPRFERLWNAARRKIKEKNPQAKLMVHSCGNVRPFIPSWIDMGLDVLDPIQPLAQGMEPEGLKRDFGEQLVFHGGIDLQHLLPFGTREEVMAEVRRYIRALGPGGGYIVAPAHNVQSDAPPANLVAIRDAVEAYGNYPVQ
jgi:uroporphyrinogen decarboxylase|tara:strand:- start:2102 stop:3280 length:1179 start_codon:yes stop_codon:yes gene_type:complete